LREQERLRQTGEPIPRVGVVSDAERKEILARGVLNDVATALWIKGRAAEYLAAVPGPQRDTYLRLAKQTYQRCLFAHARTWDPKGWFWDPCQNASDRLAKLRR
jgi:hypothetical protein